MHKDCSQRDLGQNLYSNFKISGRKTYPPTNFTRVIYEWANESKNWDWATATCQKGKKCGHWQAVTGAKGWKVGCGIARCPMLDVHGVVKKLANFIVCDYGPFSMDFERGNRCSNCGNSTVDMDEKGFTCENELCVQCDPKKKPECKCGTKYECRNGGEYTAEICGCKCPSEYYGEICEMPCKCDDINPNQCKEHATECKSESQQSWIGITCQKTCNTCIDFQRPASCKSDNSTLPTAENQSP